MLSEGNLIYLFAAYAVFLGGIALYLVSLFLRQRNLERQAHALEKIAREIKDEG